MWNDTRICLSVKHSSGSCPTGAEQLAVGATKVASSMDVELCSELHFAHGGRSGRKEGAGGRQRQLSIGNPIENSIRIFGITHARTIARYLAKCTPETNLWKFIPAAAAQTSPGCVILPLFYVSCLLPCHNNLTLLGVKAAKIVQIIRFTKNMNQLRKYHFSSVRDSECLQQLITIRPRLINLT